MVQNRFCRPSRSLVCCFTYLLSGPLSHRCRHAQCNESLHSHMQTHTHAPKHQHVEMWQHDMHDVASSVLALQELFSLFTSRSSQFRVGFSRKGVAGGVSEGRRGFMRGFPGCRRWVGGRSSGGCPGVVGDHGGSRRGVVGGWLGSCGGVCM